MNVTQMMAGAMITIGAVLASSCGSLPTNQTPEHLGSLETRQEKRETKALKDLGVIIKRDCKTFHERKICKKILIQRCYPHSVSPGYNGWIEWGGREGDRELKLLLVNCFSV